MNISELKLKPTLIKIVIDDEVIVKEYGEPICFYMFDHLDIKTYFEFFESHASNDTDKLLQIVSMIIKNEDGSMVLTDGYQLPVDIFAAAVVQIGQQLGKSKTKNSTSVEIGTQP